MKTWWFQILNWAKKAWIPLLTWSWTQRNKRLENIRVIHWVSLCWLNRSWRNWYWFGSWLKIIEDKLEGKGRMKNDSMQWDPRVILLYFLFSLFIWCIIATNFVQFVLYADNCPDALIKFYMFLPSGRESMVNVQVPFGTSLFENKNIEGFKCFMRTGYNLIIPTCIHT